MRKPLFGMVLITALFFFSFTEGYSDPKVFNTYRSLTTMQQASPGAMKFGLYGFNNPAMLEYVTAPFDLQLSLNTAEGFEAFDRDGLNSWGLFSNIGNTGIGAYTRRTADGNWVTDYRISATAGTKDLSFGMGYGFSGENKSSANFSNLFNYGILWRPIEQVSIGITYTDALESSFNESVAEIAVRPIGSWPLTFYGDYSYATADDNWGDIAALGNRNFLGAWSAGVSAEFPFLEGIRLNFRYLDSELDAQDMVMGGIDVSLGGSGIGAASFMPETDGLSNSVTTHFRLGAFDRTLLDDFSFMDNYIKLDLSGPITYQPYMYFDNRQSFYDILNAIDMAAKDENVSGLFVNSINMGGSYAMKWEIREKLKEFKEEYGKEVIIFIERQGIGDFHFASVADKIVMDEMGAVSLNGYVAGRSYYKNMLDDIGIGFTELRFMKYKSAVESYSRTDFSEGDKEQREAYINDWYETARKEITEERGISEAEFDDIVNSQIIYNAQQLKDLKLIDETGRWHELDDLKDALAPNADMALPSGALYKPAEPIDDQWSLDRDIVALIYADGPCAMEGGINARSLYKYVKRAVENPNVGAIVLRVDSPGGDALASEYIAEIVRENKGKKPIIVSQGMLAASGGYWLSMDADEIYSTPVTITGSIGVISGWFYDKGLQDTIGITTDHVQKGKFADLGFSWNDPIIGVGLPVRDMTAEEKELREADILRLYDEFIEKVANGRFMEEEEVKEVAQGRVWTGKRALGINLVDKIGGLSDALQRAKNLMDNPDKDDIIVMEYPPRGDIDFQRLVPTLLPINVAKINQNIERINFLVENNGTAMPMLPFDWQDDQNFQNSTKDDIR